MSTVSDSDSASLSAQVNKLTLSDPSDPTPSDDPDHTEPSEIVAVVDDLLNQLSSKFNTVSSEILAKMDEMSKRLDALETNIQATNAASSGASSTAENAEGVGDEK